MSTFDFSTLYTKLPHSDLVRVLGEIVDLIFSGGRKTESGNRRYITVHGRLGRQSFTKNQGKMLL